MTDWREEAWRCYCESGADPDGADARHLNPGEALAAVAELRKDYDAALGELRVMADALREIANEDFRGNRPRSATIAYNALKGIGWWHG